MSQNDLVIADQAGAAFRSDVNSALQALGTLQSGATAPATTYAYMYWADTTTNTLKQRNAANSGWIVRGTLDESFVLSRSSNTILDISDRGKVLIATGSYTQTLDAAATLSDGWAIDVVVDSGATLVVDPNGSETIDGATTKSIAGPTQGRIVCNGTLFRTIGFQTQAGITLGTPQASTSGTSIDFTGIPSGTKRITINFVGVSTSGTSIPMVQLGDSGGVETSGYTANAATAIASGGLNFTAGTTGFPLRGFAAAAGNTLTGSLVLTLEDSSDNTWIANGTFYQSTATVDHGFVTGTKATSATLDRVRITTVGGTDTFDAGEINISYE